MMPLALANLFTWDGLAIWIAAGLTLFIYSFLYKDNPFYRFAEHLYVGLGAGYVVVVAYWNDIATNVFAPIQEGQAQWAAGDAIGGLSNIVNPIIAVILGLFLFFPVVAPRLRFLTRYAFAFILGAFSGIKIAPVIKANIVVQTQSTIERACAASAQCAQAAGLEQTLGPGAFANALLLLLGVLAALVYFFFSLEHKGPLRAVSRTGVYVLMVGFGASFGLTVMGRVSLLIGRLQFLLGNWLEIISQ